MNQQRGFKRLDLVLAVAAGLCVVGFASAQAVRRFSSGDEPATSARERHSGERERPSKKRRGSSSLPAGAQDEPEGELAAGSEHAPAPTGDPHELDATAAKEEFELLVAEIDDLIASEKKLGRRQRDELYGRAMGTYKSLLRYVDATDPNQRRLLDQAHSDLMNKMKELGLEKPVEPGHPRE
jgi:hypothetical protein